MPKPRVSAAGGLAAIGYSLRKGREAGGLWKFYNRLRSHNACKTCAFGMGGQRGGMVNEHGRFPEVCKKSIQAQAGDMQAPITEEFFKRHPVSELESWTPRQMEYAGRLAFPVAVEQGDTHFRRITWDDALNSQEVLAPSSYAWDAEPPVLPDENGRYPIAMPGTTKFA